MRLISRLWAAINFSNKSGRKERPQLVSFEDFERELRTQLSRAAERGQRDVVINVLELHVALGVFPNPKSQTAANVMEAEKSPGDTVLVERGKLTGLTIRYLLPRVLFCSKEERSD